MSYPIYLTKFDEPALGFDEPALGFEDPSFGYDIGELENLIKQVVSKSNQAKAQMERNVLVLHVKGLSKPLRFSIDDAKKVRVLTTVAEKHPAMFIDINPEGLVTPRRDAKAVVQLRAA